MNNELLLPYLSSRTLVLHCLISNRRFFYFFMQKLYIQNHSKKLNTYRKAIVT
jgi:hypothetical protein